MNQALDYCREKAAQSGSNFLAGFTFLVAEKRDALTVLYAYCRELDDVVDDCRDADVARRTLAWWRMDSAKVFTQDKPAHPVNQALQGMVGRYALPQLELDALIDGMQMDLDHMRYRDFTALSAYCYCVAGVVGRLTARILGFVHADTLLYAEKLGLALQLTNIIRDVGEDARRGRIYLPVAELQQFGVPAADIVQGRITDDFRRLMDFQIERARAVYREAVGLLPAADRKCQKAGLIMGAVYYALLCEIQRDGAENVLKYKIALPVARKKRIALKTWLLGFRP